MRKVKWAFDMPPEEVEPLDGYTDGTHWNGFANIWVTPDVHAKVLQMVAGDDPDTIADFTAMTPSIHPQHPELGPLVSYAYGYTTMIEHEG